MSKRGKGTGKGTGNKRGNNEGTIRQRASDGLWEARVSLPNGRRKSLYGKTRAEVARKLAETLRDVNRGLPIAPERLTVAAYFTDWLATAQTSMRESSWRRYEELARLHAIPAIGRIPLMKLSAADLNRLYASALKKGLSTTTAHYLHRLMHKALHDAVRADLVTRNVADLDNPPRRAEYTAQTYTVEQARAFLSAIQSDRFQALYLLAIMSGMRQGELLSLTWDALDMDAGILTVRTTHRRMGGRFIINTPKTKAGNRTLALNHATVAALRAHHTRQAEERLQMGAAWLDAALVFPDEAGQRIAGTAFYQGRFLPLLKRAGLPTIRFHDLRHTVATLLLMLGQDRRIVRDVLGHSSVTITQDLYQHVSPEMQRDAVDRLERLLLGDGTKE